MSQIPILPLMILPPLRYAVYAVIGLICLYIFFVIAPSVVATLCLFSRKKPKTLSDESLGRTYYAPYLERISEAARQTERYDRKAVNVTARDGIGLSADLIRSGRENAQLFILIHGFNASPVMNYAIQAGDLLGEGFDLLVVYGRAHPRSGGRFCGMGTLEKNDILSWTDFAVSKLGYRDVWLYGTSMGATALAYAARDLSPQTVRGLVLDCGFTVPAEQIMRACRERRLPLCLIKPYFMLTFRLITGQRADESTLTSLSHCSIPCLFFHGDADTTVPVSDTLRAYGAVPCRKTIYIQPDAEHTLSYAGGGKDTLFDFINQVSKEADTHAGR